MTKKLLIALTILVAATATIYANGSQEYDGTYGGGRGQGQGLRDGSGYGGGQGGGGGYGRSSGTTYRENFVGELATVYNENIGSGVLTEEEAAGLVLMAEEEKLARDVYKALYEVWNMPVFNNIGDSEQQHMDAVVMMLEAYDIEVPSTTSTPGTFLNAELQKHYDNLVSLGSKSYEDAMKVGATIEDLDIADLQKLLENTENEEVAILYQNLMKGSRNHMRSFTAQLERYDEEYEPVFITEEYYEKILKYNREMAPIANPEYSL